MKYFKFLCILFEESLTWKYHINRVTNKIYKVIGTLNRLNMLNHKMHCYQYIIIFSHPNRTMDDLLLEDFIMINRQKHYTNIHMIG